MTSLRTSALIGVLLTVPALSGAQTLLGRSDSIFTWRGPLKAGALLTVRNHNGPIDVRPALLEVGMYHFVSAMTTVRSTCGRPRETRWSCERRSVHGTAT